jgi:glycosyltransferase involved in cell wall biosynthesis
MSLGKFGIGGFVRKEGLSVKRAKVRLLELRNTYKWGGGPDKTILLSAQRHNPARVEVVVAYVRDGRDCEFQISDQANAKGLTFYDVLEYGKLDLRVLVALRRIILEHDINLIHSHDYKSDLFAYVIRRWLYHRRIALVSTAHAWVILGTRGNLYRKLDLCLMKRFNQLIAVSYSTKKEMVDAGVPASSIEVIHNAIDIDAWSLGRVNESMRERLGLKGAFPVVGYVGRIMPEKDLVTWLRAAAILVRAQPTARFVLVGDGRDDHTQRKLVELAHALGIGDRVIFTGYQRELLAAYASFDMFLLTSRREGLPNSLLEAMAMGVPVVTTDVAGAKELVIDGETGFVLPQGDVERIGSALVVLAGNDRMRKQFGQAGRHRVECEFAFASRMRRVEDLYERVLRRLYMHSELRRNQNGG